MNAVLTQTVCVTDGDVMCMTMKSIYGCLLYNHSMYIANSIGSAIDIDVIILHNYVIC